MKSLILAAVALIAAGCMPYEERVARACAAQGYPPGKPDYWVCADQMRRQDAMNRQTSLEMLQLGNQMMQPRGYMPAYQPYPDSY